VTRYDMRAEEMAHFCLHALPAAGQANDADQVSRLVRVVLDGLGCAAKGRFGGSGAAAHRRRH